MDRKVLAFYYTWYGVPQVSGDWYHWDEGGHFPNRVNEDGYPDFGTTNHPSHGPYDSNDPYVIKRHLEWCNEVHIDVLIATWWGQGLYHDKVLKAVLNEASENPIKITIYYETIPKSGMDGVINDFRYIISNYGNHPGFFNIDGKPVIFVYGRAMGQLSYDQWATVLEKIRAEHSALFIADTTSQELINLFDGGHIYNPVGLVIQQIDMANFYRELVGKCRANKKIACTTVIPGYDDSNIGRKNILVANRRGGELYKSLWRDAEESNPDWMIITSFNEWHEGSEIEPSIEHGKLYLQITRLLAENFKKKV
ncbi:MAG: glycoside hydrolase family 99-like domain-containing protein [bacterium]